MKRRLPYAEDPRYNTGSPLVDLVNLLSDGPRKPRKGDMMMNAKGEVWRHGGVPITKEFCEANGLWYVENRSTKGGKKKTEGRTQSSQGRARKTKDAKSGDQK